MTYIFGIITGFAIASILFAIILYGRRKGADRSPSEVKEILSEFVAGKGNPYAWDDFLHISISDPYLDYIKMEANDLQVRFPPKESGQYCSEEGIEILKAYINDLEKMEAEPVDRSNG